MMRQLAGLIVINIGEVLFGAEVGRNICVCVCDCGVNSFAQIAS